MRKTPIIAGAFFLVILLVLGACASTSTSEDTVSPQTTEPPPTETTPPAGLPTETTPAEFSASDGRIMITVESVERTDTMPAELESEREPLENYDFIVISLRIDSLTGEHISPNSPFEILFDTSAQEYTPIEVLFPVILEDPSDFANSDVYYKEGDPGLLVYELLETAEPSMLRFHYRRTGTEEEGMLEVYLGTD
jgi:hypothetical protein